MFPNKNHVISYIVATPREYCFQAEEIDYIRAILRDFLMKMITSCFVKTCPTLLICIVSKPLWDSTLGRISIPIFKVCFLYNLFWTFEPQSRRTWCSLRSGDEFWWWVLCLTEAGWVAAVVVMLHQAKQNLFLSSPRCDASTERRWARAT